MVSLIQVNTDVYLVVQFYPWFKFFFLLFRTHYHTLRIPYPKTKENKPRRKLNHNIKIIHVQSNLFLRTPLYYGQLVCFQKCQKSYIPYLCYMDTSLYYGQVRVWCAALTPNNTKTMGRMTCYCFQWPIRRDLRISCYTTDRFVWSQKCQNHTFPVSIIRTPL